MLPPLALVAASLLPSLLDATELHCPVPALVCCVQVPEAFATVGDTTAAIRLPTSAATIPTALIDCEVLSFIGLIPRLKFGAKTDIPKVLQSERNFSEVCRNLHKSLNICDTHTM